MLLSGYCRITYCEYHIQSCMCLIIIVYSQGMKLALTSGFSLQVNVINYWPKSQRRQDCYLLKWLIELTLTSHNQNLPTFG